MEKGSAWPLLGKVSSWGLRPSATCSEMLPPSVGTHVHREEECGLRILTPTLVISSVSSAGGLLKFLPRGSAITDRVELSDSCVLLAI